jgi:hypothetical protein
MTGALNEAYGMVRERQLRTLERNRRYQLGLTASATDEQVRKALSKRPVPGFEVGELVSYWEPEIVDKAITHVMPKKFQYRWNGPFSILEREGDHYYVEIKGKKTLVNPGRLRKYYTWINDPWENEEIQEEQPGKAMNTGEIEVGDMVVVPLVTARKSSRPFAIGRVIAIRERDDFLVHWYGNATGKLEGTYKPEWHVSNGVGSAGIYYAQHRREEAGTVAYTSEEAGQIVHKKNIRHFGFQLVFDDSLPVSLKRVMHKDTSIKWKIPKK